MGKQHSGAHKTAFNQIISQLLPEPAGLWGEVSYKRKGLLLLHKLSHISLDDVFLEKNVWIHPNLEAFPLHHEDTKPEPKMSLVANYKTSRFLKFPMIQSPDATSSPLLGREVLQCLSLLQRTKGTLSEFWWVGREGHWKAIWQCLFTNQNYWGY